MEVQFCGWFLLAFQRFQEPKETIEKLRVFLKILKK